MARRINGADGFDAEFLATHGHPCHQAALEVEGHFMLLPYSLVALEPA